jgi:hypothetical protein
MNTKYETYKTLVVSTSHMTKHDDDILEIESQKTMNMDKDSGIICFSTGYGYRIYVNQPGTKWDQSFRECGLSASMIAVCRRARQLKCRFVEFDSDGPEYSDFDIHEW